MAKRTAEEAELPTRTAEEAELPRHVTFTVKKEGTSGGWQTTITAWNDETVDDLKGRIRDYLEAEHGLKFYKKNLRLTQNGKHVPYKDWVYSIDSKEPLVVHFN